MPHIQIKSRQETQQNPKPSETCRVGILKSKARVFRTPKMSIKCRITRTVIIESTQRTHTECSWDVTTAPNTKLKCTASHVSDRISTVTSAVKSGVEKPWKNALRQFPRCQSVRHFHSRLHGGPKK